MGVKRLFSPEHKREISFINPSQDGANHIFELLVLDK